MVWTHRIQAILILFNQNKNFNHIQKNPELFPVSEFEKLRKCVVSKQTSIFFIIEKNKIYIVSVFDTRQNPVKIKE